MEVRRTVPVRLEVTDSDADLPHETIDQYRNAAKKIRFNHLRSLHKPSDGDAPVGGGYERRDDDHERVRTHTHVGSRGSPW